MATIPQLDPSKATRDEMRTWISASARTIATHQSGSPTITSLREVMKSVGFASLSAVIAEGTMESLRTCVTKMHDVAKGHGLLDSATAVSHTPPPPPPPTPLPAPPERITLILDEVDGLDEASRLADVAADLARRAADAAAAARAAAAAPRPTAGMSAADLERLDKVEVMASATLDALRGEASKITDLQEKFAPLTAVLDAIKASSGGPPTLPPAAIASIKAAISGDRLLTEVMPFFTPGIQQGNQIPCVASPPSFGKTFMSDEISRLYDGSFFHPFKDSLDEVDSLVGTLMPRSDGTFAVIDGPLVSAARLASTGVNTLFVGDEIFNASKKTLEWMQSFLSPRLVEFVNPDDGTTGLRRCFVIQTKHSLEDGTFEVIKAPEECLHFLFLGNLRTNPPEALMSRCRLMRFDYDPVWAAETALQRLEGYSGGLFSGKDAQDWAKRWAQAMTSSREAYSKMEVSRPLCFRFLIGAVTHVVRQPGASLSMLSEYVAKWAPHQIAVQNAATQDTDATSSALVKKIVGSCFPGSVK